MHFFREPKGNPALRVPSMNYDTFWQRVFAAIIDHLVFLALALFCIWLEAQSNKFAFFQIIATGLAYWAYQIYCHGKYGKTIGKHLMDLRVVRSDGERIRWTQAVLRNAVNLALSTPLTLASLFTLYTSADSNYYSMIWWKRTQFIQKHNPDWVSWLEWTALAWGICEIIVTLSNKRRRAIHDFIAGTVVISTFMNTDEARRDA